MELNLSDFEMVNQHDIFYMIVQRLLGYTWNSLTFSSSELKPPTRLTAWLFQIEAPMYHRGPCHTVSNPGHVTDHVTLSKSSINIRFKVKRLYFFASAYEKQ